MTPLSLCVQAEVKHTSTQTLPAIIGSVIRNGKSSGRLNRQFGFSVSIRKLQKELTRRSRWGRAKNVIDSFALANERGDGVMPVSGVEVVRFTGVIHILSLLEKYNNLNIHQMHLRRLGESGCISLSNRLNYAIDCRQRPSRFLPLVREATLRFTLSLHFQ